MLEISASGVKSFFPFDKSEESLCVFEYIYFSRPDSRIFGDSVYNMRIELGRMLAKQSPVNADIVVPIRISYCAASVMRYESGIPLVLAMIRSIISGELY